jgi:hypothetical protein
MTVIYLVAHVRLLTGDEDEVPEDRVISVGKYSTRANAEAAIERYRNLQGFCRFPDGFRIVSRTLDEDYWEQGIAEDRARFHPVQG